MARDGADDQSVLQVESWHMTAPTTIEYSGQTSFFTAAGSGQRAGERWAVG